MIRVLFVAYMASDNRRLSVPPGFLAVGVLGFPCHAVGRRAMISGIATLLGVGGSVMTVPLLRYIAVT